MNIIKTKNDIIGSKREKHIYENVFINEYENILWCKNTNKFMDFKLGIDFVGIKKNTLNNNYEIDLIQVGGKLKNWNYNLNEILKIINDKIYCRFIANLLLKTNTINKDIKYSIYYRLYTVYNVKECDWILHKDYKIFLKKINLKTKNTPN